VQNKNGYDKIGYNPQLNKHKSTKISVITDVHGHPVNIDIYKSNLHDANILNNQLDNLNILIKNDNNNILLGDTAYDSSIIKQKLKQLKFGIIITHKNKRNAKNIKLLKSYKLNNISKKLLKKRIKVEHFFARLKQYKRICLRYDKYSINYLNYIYLACIDNALK
jgi:hypothetical protein